MYRLLAISSFLCLALCAPSAFAGKVKLSLSVDSASKTWRALAEVTDKSIAFEEHLAEPNDEILGIAFFDIDVRGENGLSVTSSRVEAPVGGTGPSTMSGFHLLRSDGKNGSKITAAQDTLSDPLANPGMVLEGPGLTAGSDSHGAAWTFPLLVASGDFAGHSGSIILQDRSTGVSPGVTLLYGDPLLGFRASTAVEFAAAVTGDVVEWVWNAADINGSGAIDLADFSILKANFGAEGARSQGDINGDGQIDLADFSFLKNSFGLSAAVVPEPATAATMSIGAVTIGLVIASSKRRASTRTRR